jgi:hypothetical protein
LVEKLAFVSSELSAVKGKGTLACWGSALTRRPPARQASPEQQQAASAATQPAAESRKPSAEAWHFSTPSGACAAACCLHPCLSRATRSRSRKQKPVGASTCVRLASHRLMKRSRWMQSQRKRTSKLFMLSTSLLSNQSGDGDSRTRQARRGCGCFGPAFIMCPMLGTASSIC